MPQHIVPHDTCDGGVGTLHVRQHSFDMNQKQLLGREVLLWHPAFTFLTNSQMIHLRDKRFLTLCTTLFSLKINYHTFNDQEILPGFTFTMWESICHPKARVQSQGTTIYTYTHITCLYLSIDKSFLITCIYKCISSILLLKNLTAIPHLLQYERSVSQDALP